MPEESVGRTVTETITPSASEGQSGTGFLIPNSCFGGAVIISCEQSRADGESDLGKGFGL